MSGASVADTFQLSIKQEKKMKRSETKSKRLDRYRYVWMEKIVEYRFFLNYRRRYWRLFGLVQCVIGVCHFDKKSTTWNAFLPTHDLMSKNSRRENNNDSKDGAIMQYWVSRKKATAIVWLGTGTRVSIKDEIYFRQRFISSLCITIRSHIFRWNLYCSLGTEEEEEEKAFLGGFSVVFAFKM